MFIDYLPFMYHTLFTSVSNGFERDFMAQVLIHFASTILCILHMKYLQSFFQIIYFFGEWKLPHAVKIIFVNAI